MGRESQSGPSPDEIPGEEVVIRALRQLDPPVEIDEAALRSDHTALCDALLDHADRLDGTRLLYYMTAAMIPELDQVTQRCCERDYWLFDPQQLSEAAVAHMFSLLLDGARVRPYSAWAEQVVRTVARNGISDRSLHLFRPDERRSPESLVASELCWVGNHMPFEGRRIMWMSFYEQRSVAEIAMLTSQPFERVEWLLDQAFQRAEDTLFPKDTPADDEFWRAMGSDGSEPNDDDS